MDGSLSIIPIEYASKEFKQFLRIPWAIGLDKDPCWVAPTLSYQKKFLDPARGPFFDIGEAQYFLALRDNRPVGRISAHINRRHDEIHKDETGFFGFFECADDKQAAAGLLDAAQAWLGKRGKKRILGPLSFGIYDEVGILVEGFDSLPALLQTHNPPYYESLVLDWGMSKATDWLALKSTNINVDQEAWRAKVDKILDNTGLVIKAPEPSDVIHRSDEILRLFNESWDSNWGHVPFTQKQFKDNLKELKPLLRTDLMRFVLEGDKVAAFMITIPDINPTLQKFNGRLNVLDILRLYVEARFLPLKKLRTILMGVDRKYQRLMLHHALIMDSYLYFLKIKATSADCSLIMEDHRYFIRSLRQYSAFKYKTWRLFEKEIS